MEHLAFILTMYYTSQFAVSPVTKIQFVSTFEECLTKGKKADVEFTCEEVAVAEKDKVNGKPNYNSLMDTFITNKTRQYTSI